MLYCVFNDPGPIPITLSNSCPFLKLAPVGTLLFLRSNLAQQAKVQTILFLALRHAARQTTPCPPSDEKVDEQSFDLIAALFGRKLNSETYSAIPSGFTSNQNWFCPTSIGQWSACKLAPTDAYADEVKGRSLVIDDGQGSMKRYRNVHQAKTELALEVGIGQVGRPKSWWVPTDVYYLLETLGLVLDLFLWGVCGGIKGLQHQGACFGWHLSFSIFSAR